jgi:hypothetical protein
MLSEEDEVGGEAFVVEIIGEDEENYVPEDELVDVELPPEKPHASRKRPKSAK